MMEKKEQNGLPVDRGWAWIIVIAFFLSTFIMVGIAKSTGLLLPELVHHFNIDTATAALVMGVSGIIYTIVAPFAVALGEHFSQRQVVIIGSVIGSSLVALSSFMLNIQFVIVFYGIGTGVANACLFGNGLVMLGQYFKNRRSLANGLGLSGASVGTFAIPPILQYLLDTYTLQGTLLIIGALYLNICVFGALYRPLSFYNKVPSQLEEKQPLTEEVTVSNSQRKENDLSSEDPEENHTDAALNNKKSMLLASTGSLILGSTLSLPSAVVILPGEEKPPPKSTVNFTLCNKSFEFPKLFYFYVIKMPVVVFFIIFSFVVFFGYFNFVLFLPYDVLSRGITHYEKALMVSAVGIGDLLGRVSVGILGDLNLVQRYKILATVCILCGINILMIDFADVYWWMALHAALYGYFGGCYVAINAIVLIDFVGLSTMPRALSLVLLLQGLGAAIGQPVEGYIRDRSKSFSPLNYINSLCLIIGGLFLLCYPLVKRFADRQKEKEKRDHVSLEHED